MTEQVWQASGRFSSQKPHSYGFFVAFFDSDLNGAPPHPDKLTLASPQCSVQTAWPGQSQSSDPAGAASHEQGAAMRLSMFSSGCAVPPHSAGSRQQRRRRKHGQRAGAKLASPTRLGSLQEDAKEGCDNKTSFLKMATATAKENKASFLASRHEGGGTTSSRDLSATEPKIALGWVCCGSQRRTKSLEASLPRRAALSSHLERG